jgi:hypothetical protein
VWKNSISSHGIANSVSSRKTPTNQVVAIKVIDIDEADFRAVGEEKDEQIRAFNKEIRVLRQAQESGAPNLNQVIEALPVHSQLWLICDYCPGGSVKTLVGGEFLFDMCVSSQLNVMCVLLLCGFFFFPVSVCLLLCQMFSCVMIDSCLYLVVAQRFLGLGNTPPGPRPGPPDGAMASLSPPGWQ